MYYFKTFATIVLKIGLSIQINELMKLNEYQRSGHYLILATGHSEFKIKICFSGKLLSQLEPNFI